MPATPPFWLKRISYSLLIAGFGLVLSGFVTTDVLEHQSFRYAAMLFIVGSIGFLLTALISAVTRIRPGDSALLVWALMWIWMVGIQGVVATLLIALAALGLGHRWVPQDRVTVQHATDCSSGSDMGWRCIQLIVGLAIMLGITGWLLSLEIHYRASYLSVLLLLILVYRRSIWLACTSLIRSWNELSRTQGWLLSLAIHAVALAGITLWLPNLKFDDLAYHLALPFQLQELGYYRMDPATQLWALAPWAGDVLQAIAQVLANEEARGAVNALWLVVTVTLLWQLSRELGLSPVVCWLVIALYASLPLTGALLMGMHTEVPSTALVLALVLVILRGPKLPVHQAIVLFAILSALLLALKLSNVLSIMVLATWFCFRLRWWRSPGAIGLGLILALVIAGSSYFFAYMLTGNPVLPLYNEVFRSDYFQPINFSDTRWQQGVDWRLLWNLTFDTDQYYEGWPGSFGFALLALAGGAAPALMDRQLRMPLLFAIALFMLPLLFIQYMRYAYPGLIVLLPILVAGFHRMIKSRALPVLLLMLAATQWAFAGNANWTLQGGAVWIRLTQGADAVLERFVPQALIAETVRREFPETRIFLAQRTRPYIAPFAGQAFTWTWYDQDLLTIAYPIGQDPTPEKWQAFWYEYGFTHVLIAGRMQPEVITALADASPVAWAGSAILYELPGPISHRNLVDERDLARQRLLRQRLLP